MRKILFTLIVLTSCVFFAHAQLQMNCSGLVGIGNGPDFYANLNIAPQYSDPSSTNLIIGNWWNNNYGLISMGVNCTDCGNLVNVFIAAIGCYANSKRIWYGINTKQIDPIGNTFGWGTVSWSYHQYGWVNNLVNDASLRLDRYGSPRVPTNMPQSTYNSLLINGSPPPNSQIFTTIIKHQ